MWLPRRTRDTRVEQGKNHRRKYHPNIQFWLIFLFYSLVVGLSGFVLSKTGIAIALETGLSEGLIGGVFTAVSTSLPELVIAVTAVRLKSLT